MGIIWGYRTRKRMLQFDWLHPKTVRILPYIYERKISEALEANKLIIIIIVIYLFKVDKLVKSLQNYYIKIAIPTCGMLINVNYLS